MANLGHLTQGRWHQLVGKAKHHWGNLTEDELTRLEGDMERLAGLLEERYGKTKAEARQEIDEFLRKHREG